MQDRSMLTLGRDASKKVDELYEKMYSEQFKVYVNGFVLAMLSAIPIGILTVATHLEDTAFPTVAGVVTMLLVNTGYMIPRCKDIGEDYGEKIKEVIEEDRKRQADPKEG